jgi:non-ribosomal peptide synthetase component F
MKAEIELTPQQWKRLNELARERSITLSQLLEAIVNQALTENALEDWEELPLSFTPYSSPLLEHPLYPLPISSSQKLLCF